MSQSTRTKILNTAEELFARNGFAATSVRRITGKAGVNVAALNYHFGSKERLIQEVFARRIGPLNRRRLQLLESFSEADLSLEKILEAFLRPALEMAAQDPGAERFTRLMGRAFTEPGDFFQGHILMHFSEIADRFMQELGRVLPELDRAQIFWRLHFVIGALAHTLGHVMGLVQDARPEWRKIVPVREVDVESIIASLVSFSAAGFRSRAVDEESLS